MMQLLLAALACNPCFQPLRCSSFVAFDGVYRTGAFVRIV